MLPRQHSSPLNFAVEGPFWSMTDDVGAINGVQRICRKLHAVELQHTPDNVLQVLAPGVRKQPCLYDPLPPPAVMS